MLIAFGGTLGEPEVFEALVGTPVPFAKRALGGLELFYQPIESMSPDVAERIKKSWGDEFYGAFSLRESEGNVAVVTLYEVPEDVARHDLAPRLAQWDMHELGWYEFRGMAGRFNGQEINFSTEVIVSGSVRRLSEGFERTREYRDFSDEMARRLKAEFGEVEGQVSQRER